jgi:DNA-directed RNA polymerase subunit H (RpoH/RPB5)
MKKSTDISSFVPELLPIEKSFHQQLAEVKTTIIKMFVNRGFINPENQEKYIKDLIEMDNDDMEYVIQLDKESNYNTEIKNKKVYIKMFDYKITSINKTSSIGEFIIKNEKEYKFLVVQDINSKSESILDSYDTSIEVFKFINLLINIVDHDLVPKHIVLTQEEGTEVLEAYRAKKRDMMLIKTNDPVAKYYKMKPGEIVKIIRPSIITSEAVAYRLVFKSKDLKAKT